MRTVKDVLRQWASELNQTHIKIDRPETPLKKYGGSARITPVVSTVWSRAQLARNLLFYRTQSIYSSGFTETALICFRRHAPHVVSIHRQSIFSRPTTTLHPHPFHNLTIILQSATVGNDAADHFVLPDASPATGRS
jgi:hypothetical protein